MEVSIGDYLLLRLKELGIQHIFGILRKLPLILKNSMFTINFYSSKIFFGILK